MSTTATSRMTGFAFNLDFPSDLLSQISKFPPKSCVPRTAALLHGSIPPLISQWASQEDRSDGSPRPLTRRNAVALSAELVYRLAAALKVSIPDILAKPLVGMGAACLAVDENTPVDQARNKLFAAYPEGETPTSHMDLSQKVVDHLFSITISGVAKEILNSQKKLSPEDCQQVARNSFLADSAFPLLVARAFGSVPSVWNPDCSFQDFQKILFQNGPMLVGGLLGTYYYPEDSLVPHPIAVLGLNTFDWSTSTQQSADQQPAFEEVRHAVLVIGAATVNGCPVVYFVDANHLAPIQVFTNQYEEFRRRTNGQPGFTIAPGMGHSHWTKINDWQTFGYHDPNWKTPPSHLS